MQPVHSVVVAYFLMSLCPYLSHVVSALQVSPISHLPEGFIPVNHFALRVLDDCGGFCKKQLSFIIPGNMLTDC